MRLYQNKLGRPGMRIKLHAGPANPTGVGAQVRLGFAGDKLGPARVISAGAGYWSQDSAVPVLATPDNPTYVEVRWPGGKVTRHPVPEGAKEMEIKQN